MAAAARGPGKPSAVGAMAALLRRRNRGDDLAAILRQAIEATTDDLVRERLWRG